MATLVCYCFGHSVESITEEINRTGGSTVVSSIKSMIKEKKCDCAALNPKGTCCLADVRRVVEELDS